MTDFSTERTGVCEGRNAGVYDPKNVICTKLCPDRFACAHETILSGEVSKGRTLEPKSEDKCCVGLTYEECQEIDARTRKTEYERGYEEGAKSERERAFNVISRGKSALYEICPDGHWDQILQAKMDVLCWIEESLRRGDP